jgi:type I restriction enzyme S subunit
MSSKGKSSAQTTDGAKLVPRLRFPEFQTADGWKEISLLKLARPVTDRATTGDADNVLSLSGEHGLVLQSDYFGKKIAGDSTDRYLKIRKDDFVYNDRTTKASSFGTIKRLSNYSGGIVSPIYKCFRFQPSENPAFWEWYFESGSHDPALGGLVNEGARAGRFNISVTQFLSTNAWRPDEAEQQKIADCLNSADALIEAQGRRVEALKAHKKGLMQQLFPQEGETQPRLRFPEFEGSGEWGSETVDEICEIVNNRRRPIASNLRVAGPYPYYGASGIVDYVDDFIFDETLLLIGEDGAKWGAFERTAFLASGKYWVNNHAHVLRPVKMVDAFMANYLTMLDVSPYVTGAAPPKLTLGKLKEIQVPLPPTRDEQQRIADCLTSLDDLIAAETRKLDTLKTHKKGLMQQLFPSVGEADG